MLIDLFILLMLISIVIRARQTGLVRQLFAAVGFAIGLAIGVLAQPYAVNTADTTMSRAMLSILVTLGSALVFMRLGEIAGLWAKKRIQDLMPLDKADGVLGSIAGAAILLAAVWLLSPLLTSLPSPAIKQSVRDSRIVGSLNRTLPSAPSFVARLNRIVNPNGFPDVFAGFDRRPLKPDAPLPVMEGDLAQAVADVRPSVVKIEGRGCGGIVEGSGFVAADGTVITNAHVIAGVVNPRIIDGNGEHAASVVFFDPRLDMAVLKADGLAGEPLEIDTAMAAQGTPGAALGYPNGGGFTVSPATILDQFTAVGRDIYGSGTTRRSVYEVKADIIPGNSGGPLINDQGRVIGLVFAQSTSYDQIGYTLTTKPVEDNLQAALRSNTTVGTGSCAE